jgi:hypothetical protein
MSNCERYPLTSRQWSQQTPCHAPSTPRRVPETRAPRAIDSVSSAPKPLERPSRVPSTDWARRSRRRNPLPRLTEARRLVHLTPRRRTPGPDREVHPNDDPEMLDDQKPGRDKTPWVQLAQLLGSVGVSGICRTSHRDLLARVGGALGTAKRPSHQPWLLQKATAISPATCRNHQRTKSEQVT